MNIHTFLKRGRPKTGNIKVFIDGSAGTTGLRIRERLAARRDISLITLSEERRKDPAARKDAIGSADVAFLCLPDAAAIEAVELSKDADTVIIDTSTAHRTAQGWTYGFPELKGLREQIKSSRRIANPGCHAGGFIALIAPLTDAGVLPANTPLSCFSLTGYSGGGKKMIADYETPENEEPLKAPRLYGLSQTHKHLPEMARYAGLSVAPHFNPIVSSYYAGMEVTVPLFSSQIGGISPDEVRSIYQNYYAGARAVRVDGTDENGFLSAGTFAGRDDMVIGVFGNEERITLVSRFDNLGKGASGAAIQNMNIVCGIEETAGLTMGE